MKGPKDVDQSAAQNIAFRGEGMALKDLERLTEELVELAALLQEETRRNARWLIMQRVQEIMSMIGEGSANE